MARDMSADAASKATEKLRPDEQARKNLDKAAPDNEWHEKPDIEGMKQDARQKVDQAKGMAQNIREQGREEANKARRDVNDPHQSNTAAASDLKDRVANKVSDNIPEDRKDQAREKKEEVKNKTKDYFNEKIPEERRDQAVHRLKKMIVEIQDHEDYNDAIETLIHMAETYSGHAKNVAGQTAQSAQQGQRSSSRLQIAQKDLKTLLERSANSTSLDDFIDALNDIYTDADNDPEFKKWWREVAAYIRKVLKETGYVMSDDATNRYNQLEERGRYFLQGRYADHYDRLTDELKRFADGFAEDDQNQRFGRTVTKMMEDLGTDKNGKMVFKKHLARDLSNYILPGFFKRVRYVPVPRIEVVDPMVDLVVENLILEGENLFPNLIEITNDNFIRYSARSTITNYNKHKLGIKLSQIQMDIRDVAYYVHKKQGFPSLTDTGVMDLFIGGSGLTANIALETADPKDRTHFFKPATVHVNIHSLNIKLKKSSHKTLFSIFRPLLLAVMKPAIAKAAESQIKSAIQDADSQLYEIYKEVSRQKELQEKRLKNGEVEEAQSDMKLYLSTLQRRFNETKEQKAQRVAQTKVNVATTTDKSILKDKKLPGITSGLATEMRHKAAEGDSWQSPIFSLGNAAESINVPKPAPIKRRSPNERATLNPGEGGKKDAGIQRSEQKASNTGTGTGGFSDGGSNTTPYGTAAYPIAGQKSGSSYPPTSGGYSPGAGYTTGATPAYATEPTSGSATGVTTGYATQPYSTSQGYGTAASYASGGHEGYNTGSQQGQGYATTSTASQNPVGQTGASSGYSTIPASQQTYSTEGQYPTGNNTTGAYQQSYQSPATSASTGAYESGMPTSGPHGSSVMHGATSAPSGAYDTQHAGSDGLLPPIERGAQY